MAALWQDVRYAVRVLGRTPLFTAVAVLSLSIGIGVNTLVFSIAHALLLRPFPVDHPERLVTIHVFRGNSQDARRFSYPNYLDVARSAKPFSGVLARALWPVSVRVGDKPRVVLANLVSSNYFEVLGVKPFIGGDLATAVPGVPPDRALAAVVSYRLWAQDLGSDRQALGRKLLINKQPFTVVGVAPKGFQGEMAGFACDIWAPIGLRSELTGIPMDINDRGAGWLDMVARLGDGVTARQAQALLETLAQELRTKYPAANGDLRFAVVSGAASRFPVPELGAAMVGLMRIMTFAVLLVLLIACANVASLLLARATSRQSEIGIRLALGGSRGCIVMQMLAEGMVLSMLAGAAGLLVAAWGTEMLAAVKVSGAPVPIELDVNLNRTVLGYTLVMSLLTPLIFGLVPALRATRPHLEAALHNRASGMSFSKGRSRLLDALVVAQVALAVILVSGAGLCLKSVQNALTLDPGFDVRNGLAMEINLAHGHYTEERGKIFDRRLLQNVSQLPGVKSASLAFLAPLSYAHTNAQVSVPGYVPQPGESLLIQHNIVGPRYFETLGIAMLDGRAIDERDDEKSEAVMVVNETMARRFFGVGSPVGRTVTVFGDAVRVIGVARDGKYFQLSEPATPFFYVPMAQQYIPSFSTLHVRTHADPRAMIVPIVQEVERLDPNLPVQNPRTLSDHMRLSQYPTKIVAVMTGGFGVIAMALAIVGVLGVMSYSVSRRTNEIGIRATLGATRSQIFWMTLERGLKVTFTGLAIGLACALLAARALGSFLLGIRPWEPTVYLTVSVVVAAAALAACYLPARRAANLDPAAALRQE